MKAGVEAYFEFLKFDKFPTAGEYYKQTDSTLGRVTPEAEGALAAHSGAAVKRASRPTAGQPGRSSTPSRAGARSRWNRAATSPMTQTRNSTANTNSGPHRLLARG